jgi:hypothetical protein
MTHPWLVEFFASESSNAATAIDSLRPSLGLGLNDYETPEEGTSWFDSRGAEAVKVLEAGRTQAHHLKAIHEAAGRSGCRVPLNFNHPYNDLSGPWTRIQRLSDVMAAQADAAIAQGDEVTATEHLVALFQLGNHLRNQNFLLASVMGAGFEKTALEVTKVGLARKVFSRQQRRRLLTSIRGRAVEEELVAVMKVERAWFLQQLEVLSDSSPRGLQNGLRSFFQPHEQIIATNALFFCQTLDPVLRQKPSRHAWEAFEATRQEITKTDSKHSLAILTFQMMGSLIPAFLLHEDDLNRLAVQLAE